MKKPAAQAYHRAKVLSEKINRFLGDLTGIERDFLSDASLDQLIGFKLALSDINNILTLQATEAFSKWMTEFFCIERDDADRLMDIVNSTKPNSNGYDIEFVGDMKIIAEIKCIIPINGGNNYGGAQRNAILDDAIKLDKGKKKIPDTSDFIKVIGLIDLGHRTDNAVSKLMTPAGNIRTEQQVRRDRHEIVKKLKLIDRQTTSEEMSTNHIYIKKIKLS